MDDRYIIEDYLRHGFPAQVQQPLLQLPFLVGGAVEDGKAVELLDAVSAYPDVDAEMVAYFKANTPIRIELDPVTGYPIDLPKMLTVDLDIDPRVAMDLAVVEWAYYKYEQEMKYSWDEMRSRVLRRLNRKYGLES